METGSYNEIEDIPPRPMCLDEMLYYSRMMSSPFPFVRVDFYNVGDKLYFGELTFSPGGGIDVIQGIINGKTFGELLDI